MHKVLERFAAAFPARLPPRAEGELRRILDQELAAAAARPGLALLWRPRLERIAAWYLEEERRRRAA